MSSSRNPHIRIASTGREFSARPDETILTAALRQGIVLPYSCRNGTCASCKCRLIEGRISYPYNPPTALDQTELHDGQMLSCQAVAEGDVVIESREIEQVEDIPVRLLPARVETMDRFTEDTMRLRLKLPAAARLQFLAGQYIDILLPEGKRRAFSIASPPSEGDFIELHVKHVEGGGFTGHVFEDMKLKEILRFEGPLGTFFFRRNSDRPAVLAGGGTGFAPLKAMIEELIHAGDERPLELFWGTRTANDLYATELIQRWQKEHPALNFVPVVSEPGTNWTGETGFVHEAVLRHHSDLSGWDVYMSGPPAMIHAARPAFLDAGVPEDRLFYDSFDFAPDVPPASD
ncbi:CDP-6-deoxy-delta-3,4-glucoseen reductase [Wenzhouxiangella sp. EGI_FJ10305]|uniref:CDP-6-deoxy-delta-3,4-glucoseen reductase n=1 Tax=Wenzhouxiangella sp. EGI_FJ10305 TaxID=3243768 RepID=UPI0035E33CD1